jgi:hypothetical protein
MVAANTIAGSKTSPTKWRGGGVYKPDGTPIQLWDDPKPGIAYGIIPKPGSPPPPPPPPGKIVITEFVPNPKAVSDTNGEWFEIHNAGTSAVSLTGWTIKDDGSNSHTISGLTIQPGQYAVLGKNSDTATNGGVPVDYKYSSFTLGNSGDSIILVDNLGAEVDKVAYTSGWGIPDGASLSLKSPSLDNSVSTNWCQETTAWGTSAGDKGSPGAAAVCQ